MKKLIIVLIGIGSICYSDSLNPRMNQIWMGNGLPYLESFLEIKKRDYYCVETKSDEKKAYFYIGKNTKPIMIDIEKIDDLHYAFFKNNNRFYFKLDKNPGRKADVLDVIKIINDKKVRLTNTFSLESYTEFIKKKENNQPGFKNTPQDCVNYLYWQEEEYQKLGIKDSEEQPIHSKWKK